MEKLRNLAVENLLNFVENNNLKELNPYVLLDILKLKIDDGFGESQENILDFVLEHQTKLGNFVFENNIKISSAYFLYSVTEYLKKEPKKSRKYIKFIKKSIDYLENNFDDVYLIVGNKNKNNVDFFAEENATILNFCDGLSDLLNELDYNDVADRIFLLKGKIELGFNRYFYNNKMKKIIFKFDKNANFNLASLDDNIKILSKYLVNSDIVKKTLKEYSKTKIKNLNNYLDYLSLLKKENFKEFEKELNKNFGILENFPELVLTKKEFDEYEVIVNSINKEIEINFKKLKENQVLLNINEIGIVIKILLILNRNSD